MQLCMSCFGTVSEMKFALVSAFAAIVSAEFMTTQSTNVVDIAELPALFDYINSAEVAEAAEVAQMADNFDICGTATFPDQCHPQKCNWCKSLKMDNPEGSGCKSKAHAKSLQSTARFFCNIDPTAYQCNGKNEAYCDTDPNCVWCAHSSIGKACFTQVQAKLIPHKQVCPKLATY